jgi:hypothetical protein
MQQARHVTNERVNSLLCLRFFDLFMSMLFKPQKLDIVLKRIQQFNIILINGFFFKFFVLNALKILLTIAHFAFPHQNYHHNQKQEFKKINGFFQIFCIERTQIFVNYSTTCFSSSNLSSHLKK